MQAVRQCRRTDGGVEGDVATGAGAHEEATGEVSAIAEGEVAPAIRRLVAEPEEGVEGIVVGGREAVLGGQAVVDGKYNGREGGSQASAGSVDGSGGGTEEDESAAVEVKDEGELGSRRGLAGEEEAEGGAAGGIEREVLTEDCGIGGGQERDEIGSSEGAVGIEGDPEQLVGIHGAAAGAWFGCNPPLLGSLRWHEASDKI